jgi:hypothetical protein
MLIKFLVFTGHIEIYLLFKALYDPTFFGILVLIVINFLAFNYAYFTLPIHRK